MGSTGGDRVKITGIGTAKCSATTIEIKIKRLDCTFTLKVDKHVPIPELKEQIASVTGVPSDQQRLMCHRRLLEDHNLLSAYYVVNGDTVYLVMRQQVAPPPESSSDQPETDPRSVPERNQGNQSDLSQIVSALLQSLGITESTTYQEMSDLNNASTAVSAEPVQPPSIPHSLTTLLRFISYLSRFFPSAGEQKDRNLGSSDSTSLPTPELLADVIQSAIQLLYDQTPAWESLVEQLEYQTNVIDLSQRAIIECSAVVLGVTAQNLGALFFELGRAMLTLRMGPSPDDALVHAGPSVYVDSRWTDCYQVLESWPLQTSSGYRNSPAHILHPPIRSSGRASSGQVLESSRISAMALDAALLKVQCILENSTDQLPRNTAQSDGISLEPESTVDDEMSSLSDTLRRTLSIVSGNTEVESNMASDEGAASVETQGDENPDQATTTPKPETQLDPK